MFVHTPRPLRPLKRRLFDDKQEETSSKRLCLPPLTLAIPISSRPNRSVSADRPRRDVRSPKRYEGDVPARVASAPTSLLGCTRSPTNSTFAPSKPPSPADSVISSSFGTLTPATSFANDSRASSRVRSSSYRDDLRQNNIYAELPREKLLEPIKEYGNKIINRNRTSPGLREDEADAILNTLESLRDTDEDGVKEGYISANLFPADGYHDFVRIGRNKPFESSSLPRAPLAPPLPIPKPDRHYSLSGSAFVGDEESKLSSRALQFSKPSSAGYLPYFTVEFKSEATGGNLWTATNQNAGNGALCVNVMEKLLSVSKLNHKEIDSISFSCNVTAKAAEVWIHYCHQQKFIAYQLEHYFMGRNQDIRCFRNTIRNIVDFGFNDRLRQVKDVLAQIALPDLLARDKAARSRRAALSLDDGFDSSTARHKRTAIQSPSASLVEYSSPFMNTSFQQVTPKRAKQDTKHGWIFQLDARWIFVPDEEWVSSEHCGQPVLIALEHSVWCDVPEKPTGT